MSSSSENKLNGSTTTGSTSKQTATSTTAESEALMNPNKMELLDKDENYDTDNNLVPSSNTAADIQFRYMQQQQQQQQQTFEEFNRPPAPTVSQNSVSLLINNFILEKIGKLGLPFTLGFLLLLFILKKICH